MVDRQSVHATFFFMFCFSAFEYHARAYEFLTFYVFRDPKEQHHHVIYVEFKFPFHIDDLSPLCGFYIRKKFRKLLNY